MYGLTAADLAVQANAREFVDSLIPLEVEAELAGGALPDDVADAHRKEAISRGLYATNIPATGPGPGAGGSGHQRTRLGDGDAAELVRRRRDRDAA
jgi:hypothetical protein